MEEKERQSIYIIRHGDRFDYSIGKEEWERIARRLRDPPLSDLGNMQASELAKFFKGNKDVANISHIISSPFLRCIETSNPTAGVLNLPILVDHSLAEVLHPHIDIEISERAAYFPRVDLHYESVFKPDADEEYPTVALERFNRAADGLLGKFQDKNLIWVTHAAGVVALIAALLKCKISEVPPAQPCCIYRLDRVVTRTSISDITYGTWSLNPDLNGTVAHLSELGNTRKWPDSDPSDKFSRMYVDAGEKASWVKSE